MTKEELIQKLSSLEWEDFEVKAAKRELPKSVWETVSAFSNTSGGWIVLGVTEKGSDFEIMGVRNAEKLEQDFLNTLRGTKFNVFVSTKQELYHFDDKTILAFYVHVHKNKPVYYNNQSIPLFAEEVPTNVPRRKKLITCCATVHLVQKQQN